MHGGQGEQALTLKHHNFQEVIQSQVAAPDLRRPFNRKYVPLGIFVRELEEPNIREYFISTS